MKKNTAGYVYFYAEDTTTGLAKTGATITAKIVKDGGTATASTNSVTEKESGVYQLSVTASEMNANNIAVIPATVTANTKVYPVFIDTENVAVDVKVETDALSAKVDIIDTNLDAAIVDINYIEGKVDVIDSNVTTIDTNVDNIDIKTGTLLVDTGIIKSDLGTVAADVTTINGIVDANNTVVVRTESKIDTIDTNVDTIDINVDAISSGVDILKIVAINKFVNTPNTETVFYNQAGDEAQFKLTLTKDGTDVIREFVNLLP